MQADHECHRESVFRATNYQKSDKSNLSAWPKPQRLANDQPLQQSSFIMQKTIEPLLAFIGPIGIQELIIVLVILGIIVGVIVGIIAMVSK